MYLLQNLFFGSERDGRGAGYAGAKLQALPLRILWQLWTGSHKAHITAKNVVKLWQLIELEFPEPAAQSRNPAIAIFCKLGTRFGRTIGLHATKLVDGKRTAFPSDTLLDKNGGSL